MNKTSGLNRRETEMKMPKNPKGLDADICNKSNQFRVPE